MKPTQQDIVDLAREAGVIACGHSTDPEEIAAAERLVHLALERYGAGAGGGEPVAHSILHQHVLARRWEIKWVTHPVAGPLYTHPSPTELQAEYERGLEDVERLDWMIFHSTKVSHSSDGEFCTVIWYDDEGQTRETKPFSNARDAIDAAMQEKQS